MKRKIIIAVMCLLLLSFISMSGESEAYSSKLSPSLEREIQKRPHGEIPVIIRINEKYHRKWEIFSFKKESIYKKAIDSVVSSGGKIKNKYHLIPAISATLPASKIEEISTYPWVKKIYLDKKVHAFLYQSVPLIRANNTWNIQIRNTNITGKGVSVCILDTGIDYTHNDLGGGWGKKVIAGYDFVNNDNDPIDDEGHGTHCAGIVAANGTVKGVAPDANIIAIKVLDSNGEGNISDIDKGLEWCIDNATKYNISVISMSIGTVEIWDHYCDDDFSTTTSLINLARKKKIAVVAATGNGDPGSTIGISAPACIENTTAVTASNKDDTLAYYAHRNSLTDLDAPGTDILSTYLGGEYAIASGTSMATPHVAGAFALFIQAYRLLSSTTPSVDLIEKVFKDTGKKIYDPNSGLTFPRIDVYEAIKSIYPPKIYIISPQNRTYTTSFIDFNITVDKNLTSAWFVVDGKEKGIMKNTSNYNYYNITFPPLQEGKHNVTFYANSSVGIINTTSVWFTIDINPPSLSLLSPQNNTTVNQTRRPDFRIRVWDTYILKEYIKCELVINGTNFTTTIVNNSINNNTEVVFTPNTSLHDGIYKWWVNCSDGLLSNISEIRTLIINSSRILCDSCNGCSSKISDAYEGDTIYINTTLHTNNNCLRIEKKKNITINCLNNKIISNYSGMGIYLNSSQYIRIVNCTITLFSQGLVINNTTQSIFEHLNLQNNHKNIELNVESYRDCTNSFKNITIEGKETIYLNNAENVTISNKDIGSIFLCDVNNSLLHNITIKNGEGITLLLSYNNTIKKCKVINSTHGIRIIGSGNLIYDNLFMNEFNVYTNGTNLWNITLNCSHRSIIGGKCQGGNYWSDYDGIDKDNDNIGDTPYFIDIYNVDYLPLKDMPPYIQILSPQNKTYNTTHLTLKYIINDSENVSYVWYEYNYTSHILWNGSNQSVSGTINFTGINNKVSTLTLWANDTLGWSNNSKIVFSIDTLTPSITHISTSPKRTTATITWKTNELSNSRIDYGTSPTLDHTITDNSMVLEHSLTINGLKSDHLYYYKIISCDVAHNCNTSPILSFKTLPPSRSRRSKTSRGSFITYTPINNTTSIIHNTSTPHTHDIKMENTSILIHIHHWNITGQCKKVIINIPYPNISIKSMAIDASTKARSVKINIEIVHPPPHILPPSYKLYQFIRINTNISKNQSSIREVTISFRVRKSWIKDNKLSAQSIKVLRRKEKGDKWEMLNTTYEKEDLHYVYYKTQSAGFSYFAIVGIKKSQKTQMSDEENNYTMNKNIKVASTEREGDRELRKKSNEDWNKRLPPYGGILIPFLLGIMSLFLLFRLSS